MDRQGIVCENTEREARHVRYTMKNEMYHRAMISLDRDMLVWPQKALSLSSSSSLLPSFELTLWC